MKEKRGFIVLGLGSFGNALATRLAENGCRVTGVDRDEADSGLSLNDTRLTQVFMAKGHVRHLS